MDPKDSPPKEDEGKKTGSELETPGVPRRDKHRKRGYRGYPNKPEIGGDIHVGTGFAGAGPVGSVGSSGSSIVGGKTRDSVEESEEDKK